MPLVSLNPSLKPVKVKDDIISTDISHEFISMIDAAYRLHRTPTITPDDVWLVILQYLAKNVNNEENHYREVFNLEAQKEIVIEMEEFDANNSKHVEELFRKFISQMQVGIKNFECAFSTTTTLTKICSQVSLAHMMQKFFSMRCICMCSFPSINILGTKEDWQKIITMLENFKNIAH